MILRKAAVAAFVFALSGSAALAADPVYATPERGSELRSNLLDVLRPLAEWSFGAPIEFVVGDLRVAGPVAFAAVTAQRPGGVPIDMTQVPLVQRDGENPGFVDGPSLQALLVRSGRMWVPVQHAVGATDVWYSYDGYCAVWAPVLPEFCPG